MFQFSWTQATRTKFCEGLYHIYCIKKRSHDRVKLLTQPDKHPLYKDVVSVGSEVSLEHHELHASWCEALASSELASGRSGC